MNCADFSKVLSNYCSNESQHETLCFTVLLKKVSYFRKPLNINIGIECAHWQNCNINTF